MEELNVGETIVVRCGGNLSVYTVVRIGIPSNGGTGMMQSCRYQGANHCRG